MIYFSARFYLTPSAISMHIVDMHENLRVGSQDHSFTSSNGYCVRSWSFPEITQYAVYIRGSDKNLDHDIAVLNYSDVRPEFLLESIIVAIKEYVEYTMRVKVHLEFINGKVLFRDE